MRRTLLLLFAALLLNSCGPKLSDIRITDCKLVSVSMSGLRGLDAVLELRVDNPSKSVTISEIKGTARLKDVPAFNLTAEEIKLEGKCEKPYTLPVRCTLDDDFTVFRLLSLLSGVSTSDFTADISARIKLGNGTGTVLAFRNVPMETMLK